MDELLQVLLAEGDQKIMQVRDLLNEPTTTPQEAVCWLGSKITGTIREALECGLGAESAVMTSYFWSCVFRAAAYEERPLDLEELDCIAQICRLLRENTRS